jgi:hypothetical protein
MVQSSHQIRNPAHRASLTHPKVGNNTTDVAETQLSSVGIRMNYVVIETQLIV